MYLLQLHITNLRAIRDLSVDFRGLQEGQLVNRPRRWTVFLGENGCGKSTILKAIGLLLAGSEALADLIDTPDQWIRNGAKEAKISATISTVEGAERTVSLAIQRGDRRDSVIKRNSKGLAQLDAALGHSDRNYFIAGYGAFRRPPDWQQSSRSHARSFGRASHLQTLFSSAPDLIGLEQWAMQLDYRDGQKGRQVVANALDKLLPGMAFKDIDKRSGQVIMRTVDGDIPLRQLSEGYQAMAAWAGDLLFRMSETFKDRKNPLDARGVLLIDEMDLHLHPVWKRRLVDFINQAFPNLQVIATTHSPLSIQQCNEGELYVVRREEGGPTLIPFVGEPSKMRLSELFLSPLIGLETLDSPKVAELRAEARSIELQSGTPSASDLKRLKSLDAQLSGTTPIAAAETPGFSRLIEFSKQFEHGDLASRIAEAEFLFNPVATPTKSATRRARPAPRKRVKSRAAASVPTTAAKTTAGKRKPSPKPVKAVAKKSPNAKRTTAKVAQKAASSVKKTSTARTRKK